MDDQRILDALAKVTALCMLAVCLPCNQPHVFHFFVFRPSHALNGTQKNEKNVICLVCLRLRLTASDTHAKVNLANLAERLGGLDAQQQPLQNILSLGEQQRLAFARLLLAGASLVVLDESTSALGLRDEKRMYELMAEEGVTVVSVGNRPSLVPFHSTVLRLTGDGKWALETPEQAEKNAE